MQREHRFVTYVTPLIAEWIKTQAEARRVSSSIVIGGCIFDTWQRDVEGHHDKPGTDPVRQNIFITVALDALLTHHPVPDLRVRVVDAYHRRLVRLGLVAPRPEGRDHGE